MNQKGRNIISKEKIISDLKRIGIKKGELLHLKVSLKSIGFIDGGANTILEALLDVVGEEGTLVSDAFINVYPLPLSVEDSRNIPDDKTKSYAGAFANAMINHPQMVRSKHPIQKYASIGKMAKELMLNHTQKNGGYDALEVMANLGAKNLTIGKKVVGVGTTHVAINKMGFKRKIENYGINYLNEKGVVSTFKVNWHGGCGNGFPKFIPLYHENGHVINDTKIGEANGLLTNMKGTLDLEMEVLSKDPSFYFCDNKGCLDCRLNWEHSTGNKIITRYYWLKNIYSNFTLSEIMGKMNKNIKQLFRKALKSDD
jgi:aminoglycoside 3-N-acetyltransferase